MKPTKIATAAAFTATLALGGAAGAVLGTPAVSGADPTGVTATPAPDHEGVEHTRHARPQRHRARHAALATAAKAIGIPESDLRAALAAGRSIADVARSHDVDPQAVVDALVAKATERLEEAKARLPERMAAIVEHEGLGRRIAGGGAESGA